MPSERIDWDNLRVFRIVAERGSMSAAATRLGESPPIIGRRIDDLEKALKIQLLIRSARGVELTDAGRGTLGHAHAMADSAKLINAEASDKSQAAEGVITLATGDGLGPYGIAPRLPGCQAANPRIQIKMTLVPGTPDVESGEADIKIQFTEPKSHDLTSRRLGTLHDISFASRDYLDTPGEPTSMFEYFRHRCPASVLCEPDRTLGSENVGTQENDKFRFRDEFRVFDDRSLQEGWWNCAFAVLNRPRRADIGST